MRGSARDFAAAAPGQLHGGSALVTALRSGGWLGGGRARAYCRILIALYAVVLGGAVLSSHHGLDVMDRPLGTDFAQVWVAGRAVLGGDAALPYDLARNLAAQRAAFGPDTGLYGFFYPPWFLLPAALLALLPYVTALLVWQGGTLLLYAVACRFVARRPGALLAALAYPGVYVNIGNGQNGLLTAALLTSGCLLLGRRDALAGLCFGLLAYKPQFAAAVPLALLAAGRWRAIAGWAAAVGGVAAGSFAVLGLACWKGFFASAGIASHLLLGEGGPGWGKMQSAFATVRLLGGGGTLAGAAQALVTLAALLVLVLLWRSRADRRLKSAALLAASLLVTPYSMDYDMAVLGPALLFLADYAWENGFWPFEASSLALLFGVPLVARGAATSLGLPIGFCAIVAVFALAAARAWQADRRDAPAAPAGAAEAAP